jgi:hypothetical protein
MEEKDIEKRILEIVPLTGKSVGNKFLLTELKKTFKDLDEDTFWKVRNSLLENGKLGKGRGKGGSVYTLQILVQPKAGSDKDTKKRISENELYEPVHKVIRDFWVKENEIDDYLSEITANQGKKKTGGKWTRPDITLISIKTYQYLIGRIMDVITFEIKPEDNYGIESVFETASQSVFAHKSYLCIHLSKGKPETEEFEKIQRQCENFGVGLIIFEKPDDWETYETIIEPRRKDPDPYEVNLFITQQLKDRLKEDLSKKIK